MTTDKACKYCGVVKPLTDFYRNPNGKDGHAARCKTCAHRYSVDRSTPERRREAKLRHYYGITSAEYDWLYRVQQGVCAICRRPETGKSSTGATRRLAVDHCHSTGEVRGLLCCACNRLLGGCEDNVDTLQRAIKYLAEYT